MKSAIAFRPILSALWYAKVAMILIGLQIALTLAIVCNAFNIMSLRFDAMQRPSGMDEVNTFVINSNGFGTKFDVDATMQADLAMLRDLPGVETAAPVVSVPLEGGGWTEDVYLSQEQKNPTMDDVSVYFTDAHGLDAYGVELVAGRNFSTEEIGTRHEEDTPWSPVVILSAALARRLFGDEPALGKSFYIDRKSRVTVIGIVANLQAADPHHSNVAGDPDLVEYSIIAPQIDSSGDTAMYLIRAKPGRRDELMRIVESKLAESNPNRVAEGVVSVERLRTLVYRGDRAMVMILGGVVLALLCVTALGIAGLANFWVSQRSRQIGVRRALGATRFDILRYFQVENFIVTTLGLIFGSALTYALGLWLLVDEETSLLPWYYVPVGCVCLWLLGQLAVLGPALSASRVPPMVATRGD